MLAGVLRDRQQIDLLIATGRTLVRVGRPEDALQLCQHMLDLFARRAPFVPRC